MYVVLRAEIFLTPKIPAGDVELRRSIRSILLVAACNHLSSPTSELDAFSALTLPLRPLGWRISSGVTTMSSTADSVQRSPTEATAATPGYQGHNQEATEHQTSVEMDEPGVTSAAKNSEEIQESGAEPNDDKSDDEEDAAGPKEVRAKYGWSRFLRVFVCLLINVRTAQIQLYVRPTPDVSEQKSVNSDIR